MEIGILELASGQGLWAVFAVVLLFYVLRENSHREKKYQDIIEKHADIINVRLVEIKDLLERK
jgi:hypothetical protein